MRITYLSSSIIPSRAANSIHVMKMCQALSGNGHETTLLARRSSSPLPLGVENDYDYYGVTPTFSIRKSPLPDPRVVGRVLQALWTRRAVKRQPHPDLFYARNAPNLAAVTHFCRPMILEVHNLPHSQNQEAIVGWLLRRPNLVRLVAVSAALGEAYSRIFPQLPCSRILVAHDGADDPLSEMGRSAPADRASEAAFSVGYVGHLYPGRGIDTVVALAADMPDVAFHIIGGHDADIRRWQRGDQHDNLVFHGFVPPRDVALHSMQFDVTLAPYQRQVSVHGGKGNTAQWMSPLKIFEYMALGKAIVCSDLPVLREVLNHGVNALLVAPEDRAGWANAVRLLRRDDSLRRRLGEAARDDFLSRYSWQMRAQRVIADIPGQGNS